MPWTPICPCRGRPGRSCSEGRRRRYARTRAGRDILDVRLTTETCESGIRCRGRTGPGHFIPSPGASSALPSPLPATDRGLWIDLPATSAQLHQSPTLPVRIAARQVERAPSDRRARCQGDRGGVPQLRSVPSLRRAAGGDLCGRAPALLSLPAHQVPFTARPIIDEHGLRTRRVER